MSKTFARRFLLAVTLASVLAIVQPACSPKVEPAAPGPSRPTTSAPEPERPKAVIFAVIGDYGSGDAHEQAVAELVSSWDPQFIVTVGDDYYAPAGGTGTDRYDNSTGAFYCSWLKDVPSAGPKCAGGRAARNEFFPALGNHDYSDATPSPDVYLAYFTLPGDGYASSSGNERYYDFVEGDVHFFILNSNPDEPDGTRADSKQALWLKGALASSTSRFNVVCDHHPPYSSDTVHGSTGFMQWPFAEWGADVVISGHAHDYERIDRGGFTYLVNGLGGATKYAFSTPVTGSQVRYDADWGAQKVTVAGDAMIFEFVDTSGQLVDSYALTSQP